MPKKNEGISLNKIPATSPDLRKDMLEKIREIYPALFGEGNSLNAKELQALVDDYSKPEVERYAFPWTGKTTSKRFAFTPSKARLVPDKERSVDFDTTQNLIIEGENLEVLKLLQSSYFKKVKMIYIDPPYNTGHDFVYPDDYSESKQTYWEKGGVMQEGVRVDTNSESSGRYHSNWLSMIQSRLLLVRNLLRDDGVIFVSIDDNEVHNLRKLMDEVFGEENFIATFIWQSKKGGGSDKGSVVSDHEYVVCFGKTPESANLARIEIESEELDLSDENGSYRRGRELNKWGSNSRREDRPTMFFAIRGPKGLDVFPIRNDGAEGRWRWGKKKMLAIVERGDAEFVQREDGTYIVYEKIRSTDPRSKPYRTWLSELKETTADGSKIVKELFDGKKIFDFAKPVGLLKHLVQLGTSEDGDLILDFFAGSGTLGHAVLEQSILDGISRKYILVQLPEATDAKSEAFMAGYKTISQITIERVKRAGAMINAENPEVDTGFKTLRLARSLFPQNMFEVDSEMTEEEKIKAWEAYLEKSKQAHLFDFKPDELLVEIALKDGFDLNFKVEPMKEFKKNKVLDVSDDDPSTLLGTGKTALVCLDESIHDETIKALETFKERRFICLERSVDSTRKWNLKRMFGDNLWVA